MSNSNYTYRLAVWFEQSGSLSRTTYTMLKAILRWDPAMGTGIAVWDLSYAEIGVISTVYTTYYSRLHDTYESYHWNLTTLEEL